MFWHQTYKNILIYKYFGFQHCRGLPWWLSGKESACKAVDAGLIPGSGRSPGGGHGSPCQHSCLEIPWTEEPGGEQSIGSHRVRHH